MSWKKENKRNKGQQTQDKMVRAIDSLDEYDAFVNNILPRLRAMLSDDSKSARDVVTFAEKELAARMVTIALSEPDPKIAMAAVKDLMDRSMGKAKEVLEVTSRYEKLSDEQLDALVKGEQEALNEDLHH